MSGRNTTGSRSLLRSACPRFCPSCGKALESEKVFCGNCGTRFG
ncbi:MAG TPA: hypothetical protein DCZ45_13170 [Parabacteroides goldsteinii]|nr:hypothetical protein [Parabacteroides goldsteinii]